MKSLGSVLTHSILDIWLCEDWICQLSRTDKKQKPKFFQLLKNGPKRNDRWMRFDSKSFCLDEMEQDQIRFDEKTTLRNDFQSRFVLIDVCPQTCICVCLPTNKMWAGRSREGDGVVSKISCLFIWVGETDIQFYHTQALRWVNLVAQETGSAWLIHLLQYPSWALW